MLGRRWVGGGVDFHGGFIVGDGLCVSLVLGGLAAEAFVYLAEIDFADHG